MNSDDPKFTAHALGELEDLTPAERAEIEALLASDPAAAAEAQEMQTLAARLRAEMPGENAAALHDEQRAAVLDAVADAAPAAKIVRFPRRGTVLAAIAACLVVGVSVALLFPAMEAEKAAVQKSLAAYSPTVQPEEMTIEVPLSAPLIAEASPAAPAPFAAQPLLAADSSAGTMVPSFKIAPTSPQMAGGSLAPPELSPSAPAPLLGDAKPAPSTALSKLQPTDQLTLPGAGTYAGATTLKGSAVSGDIGVQATNSYVTRGAVLEDSGRVGSMLSSPGNGNVASAPQAGEKTKAPMGTPSPAPLVTSAPAANSASDPRQVDFAWQRPIRRFPQDAPTGGSASRAGGERNKLIAEADGLKRRPAPAAISGVFPITPTTPTAFERPDSDPSTNESFEAIADNAFLTVREQPLSTFSIDVDTASYAIVRRFLNNNQRPPNGAVRIEELLNYFTYDYPQPQGNAPFSATMEVTACPWTPEHRLVRIGLKGREIAKDKRPASNLVFLIDVSGSMQPANKLPLLKQSLALLIDQLGGEDQVAIVVYAGSSGCVLEPTNDKRKMHAALRQLEAGGSTNGGSGLQLAYKLAEKSFIKGGTNRVILATDGDWNVGVTNQNDLLDLIKQKAKSGVFLTVLGVGMDNLKDTMLVKLADTGNGNYAYLDTLLEAKKVLVEQLSGTLVTIAKDVKIQVEFNPAQVGAYRLIGYEKRILAKEDFNNDKKDAGEIGAGHTVTALYEIVPAGQQLLALQKSVDALKYQPDPAAPTAAPEPTVSKPQPEAGHAEKPKGTVVGEMLTLKLRYKEPEGDTSKLLEFPLTDTGNSWEKSSRDFRFAAAVAGYGMLLRDSPYKGETTWGGVEEWAQEGKGADASGYRAEFLTLLEKAKALTR